MAKIKILKEYNRESYPLIAVLTREFNNRQRDIEEQMKEKGISHTWSNWEILRKKNMETFRNSLLKDIMLKSLEIQNNNPHLFPSIENSQLNKLQKNHKSFNKNKISHLRYLKAS